MNNNQDYSHISPLLTTTNDNQIYPDNPPTDVDSELLPISEGEHQILNKLNELETQLNSLNQFFEQRLTYDKEKEKAFDLLYSELEEFKEDSVFRNEKSLYFDLILLLDRVDNIKTSITDEKLSMRTDAVKDILTSVNEEVLEILLRQQVELIQTAPGMSFNPSQQKAIQIEETSVESENHKVVAVVRHGFRLGHRILRPEEVIVSKYKRT